VSWSVIIFFLWGNITNFFSMFKMNVPRFLNHSNLMTMPIYSLYIVVT
jgi:hypothetical protein